MNEWTRNASAQIWAFSLVTGREHIRERLEARDQLLEMHEHCPHRYPCEWVWDVWEELWWRWGEELREESSRLLRSLATDSPTKDELRWAAMTPDAGGEANLHFPSTFQLQDPDAYFLQVVEPRVQRAHERATWGLTWTQPTPGTERQPRAGTGGSSGAWGRTPGPPEAKAGFPPRPGRGLRWTSARLP